MTDDSLEERLADLDSGESSSSPSSLGSPDSSSDGPGPITMATRFWAVSTLVPQVRILLVITPGVGLSSTGSSTLLASLVGGVIVAECLLRGVGPAIASALWKGVFAAFLCTLGALAVSVTVIGSSLPDSAIGAGFLVVSVVVTARRLERTDSG
ncbi:hypothetical protein [Natrinema altunense]|uniref:Uncharacterized protein n=1 Tax=Natrinema altunense (strain JCM 12890 / CGMCC 1.3731 / AJ2) TaxID=1227494 RepID=L9ZII1_NATA2|nr:hypothetical protein [Natrinema altunense]ELY84953.1 hypothetical protein C485_13330 [Natrinema altunense JCM 12890]